MFTTSKKYDRALADLISVLKDEVAVLRRRHDSDRERIDRLTEALARKAGVDLVLPPPAPLPTVPSVPSPNPWKDPNPVTTNFPLSQKGASK